MISIFLHILYLCTIGMSLYTAGWLLLKGNRSGTTVALAACQILINIWCIPQMFLWTVTQVEVKYLTYGISYVGISFIGPAWLEFSFRYCKKQIGWPGRAVLFGISALNYTMFLCNDSLHLFYRVFTMEQVVYGPVFYFHMVYTYLCVTGGIVVVLREFMRKRVTALPLVLISLSAAIPLAFNILYLSRAVESSFDLTPPVFSLSSLLMLLAVFRYDFLDINAMAFGQIFASISEGVILYNRRGRITYCNQAAARWMRIVEGDFFDLPKEQMNQPELSLEDGTRLRVRQYLHQDRSGNPTAGIVILTDVSEYYELLQKKEELEQFRMNLAVEQERNRIAQEVHDTTGHTLTMIQSLLRLMRAELGQSGAGEKCQQKTVEPGAAASRQSETVKPGIAAKHQPEAEQPGAAAKHQSGDAADGQTVPGSQGVSGDGQSFGDSLQQYLTQAQELAAGGIRELRCAINEMRRGGSTLTVTQGIRQLAAGVHEMEIEVEIQGKDGERYTPLSPVVYACLREAITNALKYAGASHMDVIVKFGPESLSLYIFDNGQGCGGIQEGNGLRGIRERAHAAGGTVRVRSAQGEGFQIVMELPLEGRGISPV